MHPRTIIAVIISAVLAFMWGYFSWSVAPWHQPMSFKDEAAVGEFLKENAPEHGVYAIPEWSGKEEEVQTKSNAGPFMHGIIRPGTNEVSMSGNITRSILLNLLLAAALALLIQASRYRSVPGGISIGILAGLMVGLSSGVPSYIWLELPVKHTLGYLLDGLIPWTIAGAIIGAMMPKVTDQSR